MHPTIIQFGPIQVHSYGTMLMLGFIAGILLARREARRLGLSPELPLDLGVWILLASVAGARLMFAALNWSDYASQPLEVLYVWREGGLSYHGGLLGGVLATIAFARRRKVSFWALADVMTPGIALGYALARVGCFLNGCCYGAPTDLPWGVKFPLWPDSQALTPPSHPTQLYASTGSLVILLILMLVRTRLRGPGQLFSLYLMLYAVMRSIIEVFRRGYTAQTLFDGITEAQAVSIVLFLAALICYLKLGRRAAPDKPAGYLPSKRDIAISVVLTIVTCGIYDLFWDYHMGHEIRNHTQRWEINPGLDIFFMIITCNIYYFFWIYKMSSYLQWQEYSCFPGEHTRVVKPWILVLAAIFGATVVSDAILQHDLNHHWERHHA